MFMTKFNELDPAEVLKHLANQPNILKSFIDRDREKVKVAICPKCGSDKNQVSLDVKNPFSAGSPLPNKILKCSNCLCEFKL